MAQFFKVVLTPTIGATPLTLQGMGATAEQAAGANEIVVTFDNPVRYLSTGDAPTTSMGHYIPANETQAGEGVEVRDLQFVRDGSTSANGTVEIRGQT